MLDTFIHKTVNRVFNCENIDVSVPEMVELIQAKIINEASDDDLVAMRKGMYKTWALIIQLAGQLGLPLGEDCFIAVLGRSVWL